jgi:hypothetical protein
MIPYEFVTTISKSGKVTIPSAYNWQIPKDKLVRVVIWVDESSSVNGIEAKDESLEELIARIQQTPINPALMTPASGLLAEHLARPSGAPDPDFDETLWNKEWATIEAEMDALEAAKEAAMLKDFEE